MNGSTGFFAVVLATNLRYLPHRRAWLVAQGGKTSQHAHAAFAVGANDGGSSTGFLLEMARVLPKQPRTDDVMLVFFDGEEAFADWSDTNGIYVSRHLAETWKRNGTLVKIKALFNVDMIGDKGLQVMDELNSSATLRRLLKATARDIGYCAYFPEQAGAIEDDHMPFVRLGVNAIDLIDFDYGPGHTWWHTAQDTMDKLSAKSLQVMGEVLLEVSAGCSSRTALRVAICRTTLVGQSRQDALGPRFHWPGKHVIISADGDNMIRTQISLDEHEYAIAKSEAQALGISVAEFVRRAVREALPPQGTGPWMRFSGFVETGNSRSSQSIDEIVYGQKD